MIRDATPVLETKPTEKVPEYKTIEKINISKNLLKSLIKFSKNSNANGVEGFLFGHEGENEINVQNAFPSMTDDTHNLVITK